MRASSGIVVLLNEEQTVFRNHSNQLCTHILLPLFMWPQSEHEFSAESALAALDPERWQQRHAGPPLAPHFFSIREETAPPSASGTVAPVATRAQPSGASQPLRRTATSPEPRHGCPGGARGPICAACSSRDHEEPASEQVPDRDIAERVAPSSGAELSLDALPGASPYEDEDLFNLAALAAPPGGGGWGRPARAPRTATTLTRRLLEPLKEACRPRSRLSQAPSRPCPGQQRRGGRFGGGAARGRLGPSQSHGAINCALGDLLVYVFWGHDW